MNIIEYRKRLNMTQEQVAREMNISLRNYVRIEKEQANITLDTLKKLIKVLNLSDNEIIKIIKDETN